MSVGLGGEGRSHHSGGGWVSQQLVVSLGEQLAAVVGHPLPPRHPPGQDLVQVRVQGGAGKLESLVRQQVRAGRAVLAGLGEVEREGTGGLTSGQAGAELADRTLLLWYLEQFVRLTQLYYRQHCPPVSSSDLC